ncbi:unnamed protein product [Prorocentrum cordatum]|uniref:Uncharacterized protein n=1 Tax=Prorocentrum cordatum TaxID=2364126 RepID=A0ABN9PWD8_9DINO|nr:unnamed protein product [Polarella glacialis]
MVQIERRRQLRMEEQRVDILLLRLRARSDSAFWKVLAQASFGPPREPLCAAGPRRMWAPEAGEAALEAAASNDAALLARFEEGVFGAAPSFHTSAPSAPPTKASGALSDVAHLRRKRQAEEHVAGIASEPMNRRHSKRQAAEQRELRRTIVRPGPVTVLEPRNPSWSSSPATAGAGDASGPPSGGPGAGAAATAAAAAAETKVARSGAAQGAVASAKQLAAITSVCMVCLRGFTSDARLRRHEELSELHRLSVARLRESSVARPAPVVVS